MQTRYSALICVNMKKMFPYWSLETILHIDQNMFDIFFLSKLLWTYDDGLNFLFFSLIYCTLSFITLFFPTQFGSTLTMLISAVRYILTIKSAKNIQPSKKKVTLLADLSWLLINLHFDIPLSLIMESCYK